MTDFAAAFKQGQEELSQRTAAARELSQVVEDLDRQLRSATGGRLSVSLAEAGANDARPDNPLVVLVQALLNGRSTLVARVGNAQATLASFHLPNKAWPATLRYGSVQVLCLDRASVENELSRMLATPTIANELARLLTDSATDPDPAQP